MKLSNRLIILMGLLFSVLPSLAGHQSWIVWKKGSEIQNNSTLYLGDPEFGSVTPPSAIYNSKFKVRLRYEQKRFSVYEDFSAQVGYTITLYTSSGTTVTKNGNLNINYSIEEDKNHLDLHEDLYKSTTASNPYVRAEVKVTSIDFKDKTGTTIPAVDEVYLDLAYDVERYYQIDLNQVVEVNHAYTSNRESKNQQNELELIWNQVIGAESYDVEWLFVNTGDINSSKLKEKDIPVDFSQAVRINVKKNKYQISLVYPEGHLFYRVRPVAPHFGVLTSNQKLKWINGKWSNYAQNSLMLDKAKELKNTSSKSNYVVLKGFEKTLNWSYSVAYAEDGKYVESVAFFDGSQRNRQGVSSMNSDRTKVVSESKYDFEGRPVVNILPIPVESKGLKFYRGGSNEEFNGNFDRNNFALDKHLDLEDPLNNQSDPLPANSEVNKYYSSTNYLDRPFVDYTPDAQGYPYAQVTYMNDGTDRVIAQSGVGKTFRLKSDYSTRTDYTTPTQRELNRLFGTEVGYAKYYKKVVTQDPNGQLSVTYLNSANKTIATGLMGETPENLLDADDKEGPENVTENLLKNGSTRLANGIYQKRHKFYAYPGSAPSLTYNLQPIKYTDNCHPNSPISINYDVMLYVENQKGKVRESIIAPGGVPEKTYEKNQPGFSKSLSIDPNPKGSRTIIKSLRLNQSAFDLQYNILKNKLHSDFTNVKQHYLNQLPGIVDGTVKKLTPSTINTCIPFPVPQMEPCHSTCEEECENLYKELDSSGNTIYYDESFNRVSSANHPDHLAAIANCKAKCSNTEQAVIEDSECEQKLKLLKIHMSPGGTYFDNLPAKYLIDPITGTTVNTDGERIEDSNYKTSGINQWLQNNLNFNTVRAALANSFPTEMAGITSWDELRAKWQDGFANEMVKYHPEYCLYQFYCNANGTFCCAPVGPDNQCQCNINVNMADVSEYEREMTGTLKNNKAVRIIKGVSINFFAPINVTSLQTTSNGATASNAVYFHDFNGNTASKAGSDPLAGSAHFQNYMLDKLKGFVNTTIGGTKYEYSIWYVMKNPDNITKTTPGLPTKVQLLFDKFHNSKDGIFGSGKVTEIQFFTSVYNFYRKKYIYDLVKNNHNQICGSANPYFNGDTDYNTYLENGTPTVDDDFPLVYPREFMYEHLSAYTNLVTTNTVSAKLMEYNMKNSCVASAQNWMTQLDKNGCLTGLNSVDIQLLREKLIEVCEKGGLENINNFVNPPSGSTIAQLEAIKWKAMLGADATQTAVSLTRGGNTYSVKTFTEVLSKFNITSSTCIVKHPAQVDNATKPIGDCNWNLLQSTVGLVYDKDDPTNPGVFANKVIDWLNNNGYGTYTVDQVKQWILFFNGDPEGTLNPATGEKAFPHVFECNECKCEKLNDLLVNSNLDPNNLTTTGLDSLVDDLNDNYALTGSNMVTRADINAWLDQCKKTGVVPPGAFDKLPEVLRCLNSNPSYDAKSLDKDCLINSFYTALANSERAYKSKIKGKLKAFKDGYYKKAFEDLKNREELIFNYKLNEYYYTLYYYDQAGNLIKTVPPKGVQTLAASFDNAIEDYRKGKSHTMVHPAHYMITNYRHNSFNQSYEQTTPDGGKTEFWFDEVERLVLSRNAQQIQLDKGKQRYSYSLYDSLGRIKEAGQLSSAIPMEDATAYKTASLDAWRANAASTKEEVVQTLYDGGATNLPTSFTQNNLRNRVSATFYYPNNAKLTTQDFESATFYSYDIHGNVNELMKSLPKITRAGRINKKVLYDYDLLSGNVNKVSFNAGESDQFYHRYFYDDNNRLTEVETSRDDEIWEKEAKYYYYPHGPLARVEVGDKQVQAQDFAYTLQGWLKGVNASTLNKSRDIGTDGLVSTKSYNAHTLLAKDAFGFTLSYFDHAKAPGQKIKLSSLKDYTPIKAGKAGYNIREGFEAVVGPSDRYFTDLHTTQSGLSTAGTQSLGSLKNQKVYASLYNGNISRMVTALSDNHEQTMKVHNNVYRYDQLNRIKSMNVYNDNGNGRVTKSNGFASSTNTFDYHTQYAYDRNGNIQQLLRHAYTEGTVKRDMDLFTYKYKAGDNKLRTVKDAISSTTWGNDLRNQMASTSFDPNSPSTHNYQYDEIGNLIKDKGEQIHSIAWTVSGKVKKIIRELGSTKPDLEFFYDATGNRIAKLVKPRTSAGLQSEYHWKYTYYVRDAQGNVLTTYTRSFKDPDCRLLQDTDAFILSQGETVTAIELDNQSYPVVLTGSLAESLVNAVNTVNKYKATQLGTSFSVVYSGNEACSTKVFKVKTNQKTLSFNFKNDGPSIEHFKMATHDIYGSDRLGQDQQEKVLEENGFTANVDAQTRNFTNFNITSGGATTLPKGERWLGYRRYEMKNHLGNVLGVVSDRRVCEDKVLYENDFATNYTPLFAAQTFTLESGRLKVTTNAATQGAWFIQKGGKAGRKYVLSFDFDKGNTTSHTLVIHTNPYDPAKAQFFTMNQGKNAIEFTIKTDDFMVGIQRTTPNGPVQDFYLDNLVLTEKCIKSNDLIVSNDFNNGINGWHLENMVTPGNLPANQLTVQNGKLALSSGVVETGMSYQMAATPGKLYMLEYAVERQGGGALGYSFEITHSNTNGAYLGYERQTPDAPPHFYQARDSYLKWAFRRKGTGGTVETLNLDNVKVSEVTESNIDVAVSTAVSDWNHVSFGTFTNPSSVSRTGTGGPLTINFGASSSQNGYMHQLVNLVPGRYYKVTFDLSISGTGNTVGVRYGDFNKMSSSYTTSGKYSIAFKATATGKHLAFYNNINGSFSPFNITLSNVSYEEIFPANALYTEDFENHIDGWKGMGNSNAVVANNQLKIEATDIYHGVQKRNILLEPFTEYKLVFTSNMLTNPTNNSNFKLRVIKDVNGDSYDGGVSSILPKGAELTYNTSGTYSIRFKTDQYTNAYLQAEKHSSTGTKETWTLDDVRIEKVNGYGTNFIADVQSHSDYYPFGMLQPGRNGSSAGYRYGFNGMEKDDEVCGCQGGAYNTMFRHYDARIGRWNSIDPKFSLARFESPYSFSNNMPVFGSDPDGDFCIPCAILLAGFITFPSIGISPTHDVELDRKRIQAARSMQTKWLISTLMISRAAVYGIDKSMLKHLRAEMKNQVALNGGINVGLEAIRVYSTGEKYRLWDGVIVPTLKSIDIFDAYISKLDLKPIYSGFVTAAIDLSIDDVKILELQGKSLSDFTIDFVFNTIIHKYAEGKISQAQYSKLIKRMMQKTDETVESLVSNEIKKQLGQNEYLKFMEDLEELRNSAELKPHQLTFPNDNTRTIPIVIPKNNSRRYPIQLQENRNNAVIKSRSN